MWKHDLGGQYLVLFWLSLSGSSLVLCFQDAMQWAAFPCEAPLPWFCLEPADRGLRPPKPWDKEKSSSFKLQVSYILSQQWNTEQYTSLSLYHLYLPISISVSISIFTSHTYICLFCQLCFFGKFYHAGERRSADLAHLFFPYKFWSWCNSVYVESL